MTFDTTQVYNYIKHQKCSWARLLIGSSPMCTFTKEGDQTYTPETLAKAIKEFTDEFPGVYNVQLKKNHNSKPETLVKMNNVNFGDYTGSTSYTNTAKGNHLDITALKKEWELEMYQKMQHEKKMQVFNEDQKKLNQQLKMFETVSGKASILFDIFMNNIVAKHFNQTGNLGTTIPTDMSNNQSEQQQIYNDAIPFDQFTPAQQQMCTDALNNFITIASPETILLISKKLAADPSLINKVKPFI